MEELIKAVYEALNAEPIRPDDTFTTSELEDKLKEKGTPVNRKTLLRALRALKKSGTVTVEKRVPMIDVSDRHQNVRGWRLVRE